MRKGKKIKAVGDIIRRVGRVLILEFRVSFEGKKKKRKIRAVGIIIKLIKF